MNIQSDIFLLLSKGNLCGRSTWRLEICL